MVHRWRGRRLFILGVVVVVAATATVLYFARDKGFPLGDLIIDPDPAIDPGRTYELTLWEEEIIIPWAAKTHPEIVLDAIREFQRLRPNAAVSYILMDPVEAREKLDEALAQGAPPDVYGTAQGVVGHDTHLVPASPYMADQHPPTPLWSPLGTGEELLPATPDWLLAASMVEAQGGQMGWPRALWWFAWLETADLGHETPSPGSAPEDRWPNAAVHATDILLLEQWLAAAGAGFYMNEQGELQWTEPLFRSVARGVAAGRAAGTLPEKRDVAAMARSRLDALFRGKANMVGPVGPHTAQAAMRHSPGRFRLAAAPAVAQPSGGPKAETPSSASTPSGARPHSPGLVFDVSAYFVFRHTRYEGDAQTRLAVELASFLASYTEHWLIEALGLLPASNQGRATWAAKAPLDEGSRRFLEEALRRQPLFPGYELGLRRPAVRSALGLHWAALWHEETAPDLFAQAAAAAVRQALADP